MESVAFFEKKLNLTPQEFNEIKIKSIQAFKFVNFDNTSYLNFLIQVLYLNHLNLR